MQHDNPNLLLKQQVIRRLTGAKNNDSERKSTIEEDEKRESFKINLINTQIVESSFMENNKVLCYQFDVLKQVLEHLLNYVECILLDKKHTNRLSMTMHAFALNDNVLKDTISHQFLPFCEPPDVSVLEEVKVKLLLTLINLENVSKSRIACQQKEHEYQLAAKNYKIILEVVKLSDTALDDLKKQFDLILGNYQQVRNMLDNELPDYMKETTNVFCQCVGLLCGEMELQTDYKIHFCNIMKDFIGAMPGTGDNK